MSTTDNTGKAPQPETIQTPTGILSGVPDILYPNTPGFEPKTPCPVGGVILAQGDLEYNTGRRTKKLKVRNTGDRPVQIGSHYHFFEVNRYLEFDRKAAFGYHLNIPATTAVRFEPGEEKEVEIVSYAGKTRVIGFNDLVNGYTGLEDTPTYYPKQREAYRRMAEYGFKDIPAEEADAEFTQSQTQSTKK
jgi:urease subunit beta 2